MPHYWWSIKQKAMPNNTTPTQKKKTDQNQPVIINPQHVLYMTWYILLFTVLIVAAFVHFYRLSEAKQVLEVVSWNNEKQQSLRSGPVWFGYDEQARLLKVKGVIDDTVKMQLLKLYPSDSSGYASYQSAIDLLAFKTQTSANKPPYLLVLVLGGLAAMIGVQIRTIYHFLDHACYKRDFDAKIWWPWYVVRPWVGFLLGAALILLAEVNLFSVANAQYSQIFWIGFSILAGFSTPDVIRRLGKASEAIFGIDNNPRPTPVPTTPAAPENDGATIPPATQPEPEAADGQDNANL